MRHTHLTPKKRIPCHAPPGLGPRGNILFDGRVLKTYEACFIIIQKQQTGQILCFLKNASIKQKS